MIVRPHLSHSLVSQQSDSTRNGHSQLHRPNLEAFLQTPPLPEYVSGHSTISAATSIILGHYFGDQFAYTDSVDNRFGLPSRLSYYSFAGAANEAAQSRFYGVIDFEDAVTNGLEQGQKVGHWVLTKLNSEKDQLVTHR